MNKITTPIAVFFLSLFTYKTLAQEQIFITLRQSISEARQNSIASLSAKTNKENSYWTWRTHLSNYRPQLTLGGTLFNFNRDFQQVQQPDGNVFFQPISNNFSSINLQLSQTVSSTGTEIFAITMINRFDNYALGSKTYNTNPLIIGIKQSFFSFNSLRWDKKTEPLRYEESKKEFAAELEHISLKITKVFFDLLEAQINFQTAKSNLANADTLLAIGERRYAIGNLYKNELLQLQLLKKTAQKTLSQYHLDREISTLKYNATLGYVNTIDLSLSIPEHIPDFIVDKDLALTEALSNRHEIISYERRKIEADRGLAEAKGDRGINMNFYATVGLTNQGNDFSEIYTGSRNQESISIGFTIPILDWGRSKSKLQTAITNQKMVSYAVHQDEINFRQQVLSLVRQFNTIRKQFVFAKDSYEISLESFKMSKKRYLSNNLDFTKFNIALSQKDQAQQDYIQALRSFWEAYYSIRYLTLYDFEKNVKLIINE